MTEYRHRFIIIAKQSHQERANRRAKDWDPDVGGYRTFAGLTHKQKGQKDPKYSICNTAATDEMRDAILEALEEKDVEAVYDLNEKDAHGKRKWSLDKVLTKHNLEVIVQELEEESNGKHATD